MNYIDNEDELERLRARSRRGAGGGNYSGKASTGKAAPSPSRQAAPPRQQAFDSQHYDDYDDGDYFDQEYSQEEYGRPGHRQIDFDLAEDGQGYGAGDYGYSEEEFRDTPQGRGSRTGRHNSAFFQSGPNRKGRDSSGNSPSPKTHRPSRKSSRSSQKSWQGEQDSYEDRNGRNRDAKRRPGQGQMAKRRKKKSWKGILLLFLAAFIGYGAWLFLHRPTGIWNIAVFGVDSRDGNTKNALADVQMICSINRSTGEIKLVSVYRDTYLKINSEGTYHKINEAYFKGGQEQAVAALEENLDIKIDDYATFNWKSVAEAINILGGVDIDITPAEFKYINAFITETVNSTGIGSVQLTAPGPNHLDGVQAVAYSRLRLMDTDFQRTERQRKVVTLALEKAKQADVSTLTSLAAYLVPQISTSVGLEDVLPLAKDAGKYHIGETAGFPFSRQTKRVGRMDCVVPTTLESNVILLHQFLYGQDTSYTPSSAVKKISSHISQETGLYEEGKPAPSGSSSGGSSGKDSGKQPPAQTAPAQTSPPETAPTEESTGAGVEEGGETTVAGTEPAGEQDTDETGEIGPGIPTKPDGKPDSTSDGTDEWENGPGVPNTDKPGEKPTKPDTTQAQETPGPGGNTDAAQGSKPSAPGSNPSAPGSGQAAPGSDQIAPGSNQTTPGSNQAAPGSNPSAPGEGGPGV